MAQTAPVSKKTPKNLGMGAKWHGESTSTDANGNKVHNCPCQGQPQPVSKRLAARRKEVPTPGSTGKMKFHVPGSQKK